MVPSESVQQSIQPYAPVVLKLLQGVIYSNDLHWDRLQSYLSQIEDYFARIGLQVKNYETEGFAYLSQPDADPDLLGDPLPRLTARRRLNFKLTVFCVLLREQLLQFDASADTGRLVLDIERLRDLLQPYLPAENNESNFRRNVMQIVNQALELGFLRRLASEEENYEVRPILKAMIDAEMLENLKEKLEGLQ